MNGQSCRNGRLVVKNLSGGFTNLALRESNLSLFELDSLFDDDSVVDCLPQGGVGHFKRKKKASFATIFFVLSHWSLFK